MSGNDKIYNCFGNFIHLTNKTYAILFCEGVLLEMTHKQAFEMAKGVAKGSTFRVETTRAKGNTPTKGSTLKTSIYFFEQCIFISVIMDLNRILARHTLYPQFQAVEDFRDLECDGHVRILNAISGGAQAGKESNMRPIHNFLDRIVKAIGLNASDPSTIVSSKKNDRRTLSEIEVSMFTITYSNALALVLEALKKCQGKIPMLRGGKFVGISSARKTDPLNGITFETDVDTEEVVTRLLDDSGFVTSFGALNPRMLVTTEKQPFIFNPQVVFGILCKEFRPVQKTVADQSENDQALYTALRDVANEDNEYNLGWFNIKQERKDGTGESKSTQKMSPHERNMEAIGKLTDSGNILRYMNSLLVDGKRFTDNHKEEQRACMTRLVEITQKLGKDKAEEYIMEPCTLNEEKPPSSHDKSKKKKRRQTTSNKENSKKAKLGRALFMDGEKDNEEEMEWEDGSSTSNSDDNKSPIEQIKEDVKNMPRKDNVHARQRDTNKTFERMILTMNKIEIYPTMTPRKAKQQADTAHAMIWKNLQEGGRWSQQGWVLKPTICNGIMIERKKGDNEKRRIDTDEEEDSDENQTLNELARLSKGVGTKKTANMKKADLTNDKTLDQETNEENSSNVMDEEVGSKDEGTIANAQHEEPPFDASAVDNEKGGSNEGREMEIAELNGAESRENSTLEQGVKENNTNEEKEDETVGLADVTDSVPNKEGDTVTMGDRDNKKSSEDEDTLDKGNDKDAGGTKEDGKTDEGEEKENNALEQGVKENNTNGGKEDESVEQAVGTESVSNKQADTVTMGNKKNEKSNEDEETLDERNGNDSRGTKEDGKTDGGEENDGGTVNAGDGGEKVTMVGPKNDSKSSPKETRSKKRQKADGKASPTKSPAKKKKNKEVPARQLPTRTTRSGEKKLN